MFLRRRGCLFGCGSFLLICVVVSLAGWFVGIPRLSNALEEGLGESISTAIVEDLTGNFSQNELQSGADVRISFDTINTSLMEPGQTTDNLEQVERFEITSRGDELVLTGWFNGDSYEMVAIPEVTPDGRLNLKTVSDGGWLQGKILDVLAGGMERAVNDWLGLNGLVLTGVELEEDGIILMVHGE
jgi:hypothetical protein